MKKIFTLFALIFFSAANAQNIQGWIWDVPSSMTVQTITNGTVIPCTTTANLTTEVIIKFQNTSTTNNTYNVIRVDKVLNPGAKAHFCFGDLGSCYDETTTEPTGDFCNLAAGEETAGGKNLITDFDEAPTVGYSAVYYKIFNMATGKNGADTLSFTLKYNQLLGVKENTGVIASNSDIYPNPSNEKASISIFMTHDRAVKLHVHNALGTLVYSGSENLVSGKNKVNLDCSKYPDGLYFVTVDAGDSKITKRLVVNK